MNYAPPIDLGGVVLLDTHHEGYDRTIGAFLVPLEGGAFFLVETGPGSTLSRLREGIRTAGFELDGLQKIFVTHIHLDHAGAAGQLSRETGAVVVVHRRGAPHLVDPSRLLASAGRLYGDAMGRLWGDVVPVLEERIEIVEGGETLTVDNRTLRVLYTPGHASHHVCFLLDDGSLFTGDAAAIRLPGSEVIRPAVPPPEIDLELWEMSIDAMRAVGAERLMLTHFGEVTEVDSHLATVPRKNRHWAEEVLNGLHAGDSQEVLEARIVALSRNELVKGGALGDVIARHAVSSDARLTVMGLTRYWRKHHPERIEESTP
ncbi:MAG: MBL fold metallo-hydrolase [Trueperaceae bacterium]|nr:MAG: MBL fold metallo-hydrolase [Trueperaceae bacterium]